MANGDAMATLRPEVKDNGKWWLLEGEPHVVVMAKKLFPGSESRDHGRGKCRFPVSRRLFGDLVWLMQRYPIRVLPEFLEEFQKHYQEACAYVKERASLIASPRAGHPGLGFKGELKPFQSEGLSWLLANQRTLLADEMGLGKTVQAIAWATAEQKWPLLVVPPPHLVRHWEEKLEYFLEATTDPLFAQHSVSWHTIRKQKPYELPQCNIVIIHYLLLSYWRRELKEYGFQRIVFDEIQELRHSGTEKYSAASDISCEAEGVIGLSGTPIYNQGGEIWNVLNVLDYHCLGDWESFSREWCHGYGDKFIKDPDMLGEHLRREGLMIRRRKEDVMGELPPKRRIVENIDSAQDVFRELIKEAVGLVRRAGLAQDPLERGRIEREAVNSARQATGIAKATAAGIFIRGLLDAGEPALVFAHHHRVFDILKQILHEHKPVAITGHESSLEKWAAKEKFQKGETNVCLIALRSATGIDGLQDRARVVVFVELDWSPAIHSQAEDRAHRTGQKDSVLCYYLVSNQGYDAEMQEALGLKVSQFLGLMGDENPKSEDEALANSAAHEHMRKVVQKLKAMA